MAALVRNASYTSQMLGFARTQLTFLDQELNPYQQRVIKHAFISQATCAFLAYLEEIEFLQSSELPAVNVQAFLQNRFKKPVQDFRIEEISKLLGQADQSGQPTTESWLNALLNLFDASQHSVQVSKPQSGDEEAESDLIIAVSSKEDARHWWNFDKTELEAILESLNDMIQRQREFAAES